MINHVTDHVTNHMTDTHSILVLEMSRPAYLLRVDLSVGQALLLEGHSHTANGLRQLQSNKADPEGLEL